MNRIDSFKQAISKNFEYLTDDYGMKMEFIDYGAIYKNSEMSVKISVDRYYPDVFIYFTCQSGERVSVYKLISERLGEGKNDFDEDEFSRLTAAKNQAEANLVMYSILIDKYFRDVVSGEFFR